ncbi:hypothetical protein M426DRAFT_42768, partial [Hypoxylon sp. CI-4A]
LALDGGIALVTGAAGGIGKETAIVFAEAGALGVIFADINEEGAQEAAEQSRNHATNKDFRPLSIYVDISDENSVHIMADTTISEFGRIDYSINSAGVS